MQHHVPPGPVTGPLTEQERTYGAELLQTTQAALHKAVKGLSDAQLRYKPAADSWSIAEILEHVALIEQAIFGGIQKGMAYPANPDKRTELQHEDVFVIKAVRSRNLRVPAPAPFLPTGQLSPTESLALFDEQRATAIAYIQATTDDFRTHYFRHMMLGWLDCYQALLLLASHGERHRKQLEEVKSLPEFPA